MLISSIEIVNYTHKSKKNKLNILIGGYSLTFDIAVHYIEKKINIFE
jgi:hypothetical protein